MNLVVLLAVLFVVAGPSTAQARHSASAIPRIGFISSTGTPEKPSRLYEAFRQGLMDLGYADGKSVSIVNRYAHGRLDLMPSFVNEFVEQKVDVIIGVNNVVIRAAKKATKTIPIVMISSIDPVEAGYVESFVRPGGNITGLAWLNRVISPKRLELLKAVFPDLSRAAILWDADGPGPVAAFKEYTAAAKIFNIDLHSLAVRGPNPDFPKAFRTAESARAQAVIVVGNPLMSQHLKTVFALAAKHRLPTLTEEDRYVMAGGLISYGASFADLYRRAAGYVVDILKGASPADLPVKQASRFETFINLNTAEQLGIVMPKHVLIQADKIVR